MITHQGTVWYGSRRSKPVDDGIGIENENILSRSALTALIADIIRRLKKTPRLAREKPTNDWENLLGVAGESSLGQKTK